MGANLIFQMSTWSNVVTVSKDGVRIGYYKDGTFIPAATEEDTNKLLAVTLSKRSKPQR